MIWNCVVLLFGFALLLKGADAFVDGSSGIARLLRVPGVVIGLTIVAIGTSLPEASVSITAGLVGANGLSLGNVIGSNIFNLMVVACLCALIMTFSLESSCSPGISRCAWGPTPCWRCFCWTVCWPAGRALCCWRES